MTLQTSSPYLSALRPKAKSCQEYLQLPDISTLTFEPLALKIEANPYILPSFFSDAVQAGIETVNSICGDLKLSYDANGPLKVELG